MKNVPLTGSVNRHFGIKKRREIGTDFYCNHGAPSAALANANLQSKTMILMPLGSPSMTFQTFEAWSNGQTAFRISVRDRG